MFPWAKQRLLPRYSNIPYMPLAGQPTPRQRFLKGTLKVFIIIALIVVGITTFCLLYNPPLHKLRGPLAAVPVIPEKFPVVGLVFYGRRSRVEVLQCYLLVRIFRFSV